MLALENTETIIMTLGTTIVVLLLFVILTLVRQNQLLRKNLKLIARQTESLEISIDALADRTQDFGKEYKKLQADMVVKELYSAGTGSYQQAINAAKGGADAWELVEKFGMNKSEAELLVSIHGKQVATL